MSLMNRIRARALAVVLVLLFVVLVDLALASRPAPYAIVAAAVILAVSSLLFFATIRPLARELERAEHERQTAASRLQAVSELTAAAPDPAWVARQVTLASEHV